MIPVVFTTLVKQSKFRNGLSVACATYWFERCRPVLATPMWFTMQLAGVPECAAPHFRGGRSYPCWELPALESQRWRHRNAYDAHPDDPYYVLTDDDILPFPVATDGQPWWDAVRRLFARTPRLAMVQPFLLNEHTTPQGQPDLIPARAIGGCRVVRRAAVTAMLERTNGEWPAMIPTKRGAYDAAITEALSAAEWFCATYPGWWATHAGRNDSTISPKGYNALTETPRD